MLASLQGCIGMHELSPWKASRHAGEMQLAFASNVSGQTVRVMSHRRISERRPVNEGSRSCTRIGSLGRVSTRVAAEPKRVATSSMRRSASVRVRMSAPHHRRPDNKPSTFRSSRSTDRDGSYHVINGDGARRRGAFSSRVSPGWPLLMLRENGPASEPGGAGKSELASRVGTRRLP